jgi:hypothetical protein
LHKIIKYWSILHVFDLIMTRPDQTRKNMTQLHEENTNIKNTFRAACIWEGKGTTCWGAILTKTPKRISAHHHNIAGTSKRVYETRCWSESAETADVHAELSRKHIMSVFARRARHKVTRHGKLFPAGSQNLQGKSSSEGIVTWVSGNKTRRRVLPRF